MEMWNARVEDNEFSEKEENKGRGSEAKEGGEVRRVAVSGMWVRPSSYVVNIATLACSNNELIPE